MGAGFRRRFRQLACVYYNPEGWQRLPRLDGDAVLAKGKSKGLNYIYKRAWSGYTVASFQVYIHYTRRWSFRGGIVNRGSLLNDASLLDLRERCHHRTLEAMLQHVHSREMGICLPTNLVSLGLLTSFPRIDIDSQCISWCIMHSSRTCHTRRGMSLPFASYHCLTPFASYLSRDALHHAPLACIGKGSVMSVTVGATLPWPKPLHDVNMLSLSLLRHRMKGHENIEPQL